MSNKCLKEYGLFVLDLDPWLKKPYKINRVPCSLVNGGDQETSSLLEIPNPKSTSPNQEGIQHKI